jgi:glycosyltransferase involved in cell wall biosynthesis
MGKIGRELVSICVPAYNVGRYISHTLESLINQSYRRIEIIVSDNASTDGTAEIVESYARLDSRIKYRRNQENIGYVRNIEQVVGRSSGQIVAVYHADDIYEPEIIERELAVLDRRPDISAVFSKCRTFYGEVPESKTKVEEAWECLLPYDPSTDAFYGASVDFFPIFLDKGNPFCCPSFMTRKDAYLAIGGFSERFPSNEDLELWVKYLQDGKKLAITASTLINYRRSLTQGSSYWESRLELPVFYSVIDEMVLPFIENNSIPARIYRQRKASSYIDLACRLPLSDERRQAFLKKSITIHHYLFFSENGFIQRFPRSLNIPGIVKHAFFLFKACIRRRFPITYAILKRVFNTIVFQFR